MRQRFADAGKAFSALLLLAGCAHTPTPSPAVEVRFQRVVVETQRPCPVTIPQRPAPLATPLPPDLGRLAALLGQKLREWSGPGGYGERADAAIRTCVAADPH